MYFNFRHLRQKKNLKKYLKRPLMSYYIGAHWLCLSLVMGGGGGHGRGGHGGGLSYWEYFCCLSPEQNHGHGDEQLPDVS